MSTSPVHVRFKADWGAFNLTRICGWLAFEVGLRTGDIHHVIHTGRGMVDNVMALADGEVDVAVTTPDQFARMALDGTGVFKGRPVPNLRALGNVPHDDAMLFCIPAELGIKTMAELREAKPKLRIALSPDDGDHYMGYGAAAILRASGIEPQDIVDWGGELVYGEDPGECIGHINEGRADSIIQEAIMTPWWKGITENNDFAFLSLEPAAVERIKDEFAISCKTVKEGRLRGIDADLQVPDFGGWLIVTTTELSEHLGEILASAIVETSDILESQYRHLSIENSPLDYPMTAEKLTNAPIPFHAGAQKYYDTLGLGANAPAISS